MAADLEAQAKAKANAADAKAKQKADADARKRCAEEQKRRMTSKLNCVEEKASR